MHSKLVVLSGRSVPTVLSMRYFQLAVLLPPDFCSITAKARLHFVHTPRELRRQQRLLRIDHHVRIRPRRRPRQSHRLAQTPLHPVALHRPAQRAAHRESDAQSAAAGSRGDSCPRVSPALARAPPPASANKTPSSTPKNAAAPACTRARNRRDATAARPRGNVPLPVAAGHLVFRIASSSVCIRPIMHQHC